MALHTAEQRKGQATDSRRGDAPVGSWGWRLGRLAVAELLFVGAALASGQPRTTSAPVLNAGTSDTLFEHLSENNGLASSVVTCFAEDGDGFLWVGSQSGLQRWDGYRFWSYKQVLGAEDSLPDNLVQALYKDSQGRLWVGTSSGGLAMYDRRTDRFIRYRLRPDDMSRANVSVITGDGARGLWVGGDNGLDHLDTDSGNFVHVSLSTASGRQPKHVSALLQGIDGTLWVGTDLGLERSVKPYPFDPARSFFQTVPVSAGKDQTSEVLVLFRDRSGRIWVGTSRGVSAIEPGSAPAHPAVGGAAAQAAAVEAQPVFGVGPGSELLSSQRYLTIAQVDDGEIWLGTQDQGVLVASSGAGGAWEVRRIRHDASAPGSLADDMVNALYLGRPGIMWAGTRRGVNFLDTTPKSAFTMMGGVGKESAIRDTNVYSILARKDGSVWLALSRDGVDILDASGKRVAQIQSGNLAPETTLPDGALGKMVETVDGSVLIGTQRGLYRMTLPAKTPGKGRADVKRVPVGQEAGTDVTGLLPDGGGLWIGGLNGLWHYDPENARVPAMRPSLQQPLTDQRVTTLLKGDGDSVWVGTQNGLNRIDTKSHAVEAIAPDAANPSSLGAGFISSLLLDRQGRLWVGTFSGGIDVMEGRDAQGRPRFHRILDGLPNENVDQLLQAADGTIWASTDGGIAVINPGTYAMRVLRRADGASLPAYWNDSGAVTANGELIFGGIGGITVVHPETMKPWSYQPPVVVTNALIGEAIIPASRFNSGLAEYPVWIPPDQNNLTLGFTALDYTAPDRNLYEYKLDGFDKAWIPADATRRLARYTNLPPGDYMLELRGSNRDGVWAPTRQVRIRVLPAWFQTWWFKIAAVLLVLLVLYVMFLLATAYLRRQQHELERQVALRTAELEQMTAELKESQQQLEHMAYTDPLTGLPNRRMFTEHFKRLMALKRRQENSFSLLLMDFDDFKEINDTYGHDAGDFVLVEMASRLSALVRESDCLARLGGDEFGLILGQSHDVAGTEMVCHKIIESFMAPVLFEGHELRTAPSIGIAIYPYDGESQDKLYKAADLALYHAKRRGGNRCSWSEQVAAAAEAK